MVRSAARNVQEALRALTFRPPGHLSLGRWGRFMEGEVAWKTGQTFFFPFMLCSGF